MRFNWGKFWREWSRLRSSPKVLGNASSATSKINRPRDLDTIT